MIFKTRNLRWYQYPLLVVAIAAAGALVLPGLIADWVIREVRGA